MKQLIFISIISLFIIGSSFAKESTIFSANETCKVPKGETLVIGCTTNCGRWNRWAVKWYARKLGYRVKLVNLAAKNQTMDYSQVDGIIIPGGADINPERYKNQVSSDMKAHIERIEHLANLTTSGKVRDEFEFDLISKYFKNPKSINQPILGICRGMQALTVSQGIPLYVDIKQELGIKNRRYTLDKVRVQNKESLISEVIRRNSFRAVELHHQGLHIPYFEKNKSKWPHLEVTALSNKNRIAEVIEFYNRPVLGVQFHPEYTFGKVRRGVFKWLLKRSCLNHKSMKTKQTNIRK